MRDDPENARVLLGARMMRVCIARSRKVSLRRTYTRYVTFCLSPLPLPLFSHRDLDQHSSQARFALKMTQY